MASEPPGQTPPGQTPPPPPPPGDLPPQPPPGEPPQPYQPQPYQPQPVYGQPYALPEAQGATPAMVLGIVSVCLMPIGCCCWFLELLAIPLGVVAIFMGVNARNRVNASQGTLGGGGKATAAIVTGGIAAVLGAIILVLGLVFTGLNASGVLQNLIPSPTP
ncbi:MAG TPA: hypothetical protein VGK28_12615 [Candidatus Dormibacteraeota bacterium]|jgi:hypothetical protein